MGGEGSLFAQLYPPLIMATLLYRALKTLLSTAIAGTTNGNTDVTATQNGSIRFPPSFCHMKGSHISCFTSTINTMRYPTNVQRKRAIDQYYCHSTFRSRWRQVSDLIITKKYATEEITFSAEVLPSSVIRIQVVYSKNLFFAVPQFRENIKRHCLFFPIPRKYKAALSAIRVTFLSANSWDAPSTAVTFQFKKSGI